MRSYYLSKLVDMYLEWVQAGRPERRGSDSGEDA